MMKHPHLYLAFLFGVASSVLGDATPPLQTVSKVDLQRYVGKWYEVARYPNRFEKDCVSDVSANYTLRPDGKIEVLNACRKSDGAMKSTTGSAKIADPQTNAKLKVTFFWPFYGNYWIIGLDPDYRYAVISEPTRKYLWILSRTPKLEPALYEKALQTIRQQGLDPTHLIQPRQNAS